MRVFRLLLLLVLLGALPTTAVRSGSAAEVQLDVTFLGVVRW